MEEARGRRADLPAGAGGDAAVVYMRTARRGPGTATGSARHGPAASLLLPAAPRNPHGHAPGNEYVSRGPARPRHHHGSPQRRAARPGPTRRPAYPPGSALCLRPARPRVTAPAALRRGAAAEARPGGLKPNPDRRPRGSDRLGRARGEPGGLLPRPCQRFPGRRRGCEGGRVAQRTALARMGPSGWACPPLLSLFILVVCKSGHSPVSFSGCGVRRVSCCRSAGPSLMQAPRRSRSYLPLLAPQRTTIIPAGSAR